MLEIFRSIQSHKHNALLSWCDSSARRGINDKTRLDRIEIDLLNSFKRLGVAASPLDGREQLGVAASPLDGRERLKLMHDMFHMDTQAPFLFDWKWLPPSGLSTKDFIAPSSFDFREKRSFGMGKKQAAVSFFSILASGLNDRCLADFLAMESSLVVSLHIQAIDQVAASGMSNARSPPSIR